MNIKGTPIAEMLIPKSTSERSDIETNTNAEKLSEKLSTHSIPMIPEEKPVEVPAGMKRKYSEGRSNTMDHAHSSHYGDKPEFIVFNLRAKDYIDPTSFTPDEPNLNKR